MPDTDNIDLRKFGPVFDIGVPPNKFGVALGLRNAETAAQLRRIADRIDAGLINLSKVQYFQNSELQDWTTAGFYMEFEEFTDEAQVTEKSAPAPRKPIIELP